MYVIHTGKFLSSLCAYGTSPNGRNLNCYGRSESGPLGQEWGWGQKIGPFSGLFSVVLNITTVCKAVHLKCDTNK